MYLFFSLNINITQSFSTILALLFNVGRTSCRALVSEHVGVDVTIYGTGKCDAVLREGFVFIFICLAPWYEDTQESQSRHWDRHARIDSGLSYDSGSHRQQGRQSGWWLYHSLEQQLHCIYLMKMRYRVALHIFLPHDLFLKPVCFHMKVIFIREGFKKIWKFP